MAPNKRGGSLSSAAQEGGAAAGAATAAINGNEHEGVISKAEVEARGSGTKEDHDTYDSNRMFYCEKRVFFTGLMFLTRLPCPGYCDHHPAYFMRSLQWFPLIGTIIGAWAAVWYEAAAVVWPPAIAAAVSTLATVWLTGCLHEDGLSDCFDGFGGGWGRAQILRIMKDSRIGTYALVGMLLTMGMKLRSLEQLGLDEEAASTIVNLGVYGGIAWSFTISPTMAALIAAHAAARWTSLPLIYLCHYVQDEQDPKRALYNWFAQSQRLLTPIRLLVGTATALVVPYLVLDYDNAVMVYITVLLTTLAAGYYGNLILGGVVGDFLGATIQVTELLIYLVLTADFANVVKHWQPLAVLVVAALIPIIYSRKIVDYGKASC